jgi:hypothetical protein
MLQPPALFGCVRDFQPPCLPHDFPGVIGVDALADEKPDRYKPGATDSEPTVDHDVPAFPQLWH